MFTRFFPKGRFEAERGQLISESLASARDVYDGQSIHTVVHEYALPGDTIMVHPGTYKQTLINKSLTLIGDNAIIIPEPPNGGSIGFHVGDPGTPVQGVKISGFTIIAPDTAILLYGVSNSEIIGNKAKGGNYGILLAGASSNNDITKNEAEGGWAGISLQDGSSNNRITRNKVKGYNGIWFYPNEEIWGDTLGFPTYGDPSNNEINENTIENCMIGVYLESSQYNEITENRVKNCTYGIVLYELADNNEVNSNRVHYVVSNDYGGGIWVMGDNNIICFNKVSGKGIDLLDASALGNEWEGNKYKTFVQI